MERVRFNVAVAGCHRMLGPEPGSHNFAAALRECPHLRVTAVFDRGIEARETFAAQWSSVWGPIAMYDDYSLMLSDMCPDLVIVATRQTLHADMITAAVEAGVRGILCDKPLATSMAETDRILASCQEVPFLLALDRRWQPQFTFLCKLIGDGAIGRVTSIVAWGLPNLINHGCHWYDVMLALAGDGEPAWVSGLVDEVGSQPLESRMRMDPSGRAQIGIQDGPVLYVAPDGKHEHVSGAFAMEVVGEVGRLLVYDDARECYLWTDDPITRMRRLEMPSVDEPWPAGRAMLEDLIQAVENAGRTACDVEQARRATEIGFGIHLSSACGGRRVTLPAADRDLRIPSFPWGNE